MSDHLSIDYEIKTEDNNHPEQLEKRWSARKIDKDVLRIIIDEECRTSAKIKDEKRALDEGALIKDILRRACEAASPGVPPHLKSKRPIYW